VTHSQAEIVRQLLVDLVLGYEPNTTTSWSAFAFKEPQQPDNCLSVFNTQGMSDGRAMIDGELMDHLGFQIRSRGVDVPTMRAKLAAVRTSLAGVYQRTVVIDSSYYLIQCVSNIGQILYLGDESPNSKRQLGTLNATLAVDELPL